ncbi:MAG: hypothetical protein AABW54_05095 [Candidatus Micrarchaeota archaeon]
MPSELDPIESAAKGFTKGILEFSAEQVAEWVRKAKQGELSFIEDDETIEVVMEQRKKPELELYRKYITSPELKLQIEMGLVLRRIDADEKKRNNLKEKLTRKFGTAGLHVAELVKCGILSRYVSILLGEAKTEVEFKEGLQDILTGIDKYVEFIQNQDSVEKKSNAVVQRINANLPRAMVLFSSGDAIRKADEIFECIKANIDGYNYNVEEQVTAETGIRQRYHFIIKKL